MNVFRKLLPALLLIFSLLRADAIDPGRVFLSAPESVFPLIPQMKRMDMLDYYRAGVGKPSQNRLGGESRIVSENDDTIVIEEAGGQGVVTSVSAVRGAAKSDTVLVVVTNYLTPAADGSVKVCSTAWEPLGGKIFTEPVVRDWIVAKPAVSPEDIENILPFMPARYSFDPQSGILTLTSTADTFLGRKEFDRISSSVTPELRYRWTGRRFEKQK